MEKTNSSYRTPAFWAALLLVLVSLSACRALPPAGKLSYRSTATSTPFRPAGTFTPTPEARLAAALRGTQTPPPGSETAVLTHTAAAADGLTPSQTPTGAIPADAGPATHTPTAGPTAAQPPTETQPQPPTRTTAPSATVVNNSPAPTATIVDQPPPATSTSAPPPATPAPTNTPAPTAAAPTNTPPPAGCSYSGNAGFENQVVDLINQERQSRGLAALSHNSSLRSAARRHSQDMACNDHFSHTGTDGSTLASRLSAAGYSYSWAAENIAAGHNQGFSPQTVVDLWMGSAGHKKNILSEKARHIGVGFRYVDGGSSSLDAYYTADFGRP